jgi:hypothetical protein
MAQINTLYIKENNSKGIEMVTLGYAPIGKLYYEEEVNRDEYTSHTETFEDVIQEDGFMDCIKVFPENSVGFKIAEATHRVRALNNIFQSDKNVLVPIAILDWKDGDDEEDVKQTVMRFNNTGKTWTLYDYVKSHAGTKYFTREVSNLWNEILSKMKSLKKLMSNSAVIGIYTGDMTTQPIVKSEDLAKNFRLSDYERRVVDVMIARLENLISNVGKKFVPVLFIRKYVNHLREKASRLNDITKFEQYFQKTLIYVYTSKNHGLPTDEVAFELWIVDALQSAAEAEANLNQKVV